MYNLCNSFLSVLMTSSSFMSITPFFFRFVVKTLLMPALLHKQGNKGRVVYAIVKNSYKSN
jgi:hypothetical protein